MWKKFQTFGANMLHKLWKLRKSTFNYHQKCAWRNKQAHLKIQFQSLKVPESSSFEERGQSPNLQSQNPHSATCSSRIHTWSLSQTENGLMFPLRMAQGTKRWHRAPRGRMACQPHSFAWGRSPPKPALPTARAFRDLKQKWEQREILQGRAARAF